eukprot:scaffold23223_cov33-Tisochrysis_lutea.AAC.3
MGCLPAASAREGSCVPAALKTKEGEKSLATALSSALSLNERSSLRRTNCLAASERLTSTNVTVIAACASCVGLSATLCSVSLEVSSKAKIRWSGGLPPGRSMRIGVSLRRMLGSRERPAVAPKRRNVWLKAAAKSCRVSAEMQGRTSSCATSRL